MIVEELEEYKKDLKKLLKKYRTLPEDMEVVKKVLFVNPKERPPFSFRIDKLGVETCVIKVKKIASKCFKGKGVNLYFLKSGSIMYTQYQNEFIPWLSVIDVLMFNSKDNTTELLESYELI